MAISWSNIKNMHFWYHMQRICLMCECASKKENSEKHEFRKKNNTLKHYEFVTELSVGEDYCICLKYNNTKELYFVWEASNECEDWWLNFDSKKKENIHRGIKTNADGFVDWVKNIISYHKYYTVYLCGHSRAQAIAEYVSYWVNTEIIVVGFDGPKIGNKEWKTLYHQKGNITYYRFFHPKSPVNKVPLKGPKLLRKMNWWMKFSRFFGFYHVVEGIEMPDPIGDFNGIEIHKHFGLCISRVIDELKGDKE